MEFVEIGWQVLADPHNVLMVAAGLLLGIVFGALPGLNAIVGVALVLPFTFSLSPVAALSLLIGLYKGGVYAGSLPAILLNIPGAPEAAATSLDGNALVRRGLGAKAIGVSLFASVSGCLVGDLFLIAVAAPLASVALRFGPAEFFALFVFSLSIVGAVSGRSLTKGIAAALLGLIVATIGMDQITGTARFTFGVFDLSGGISLLSLIMGVFAISEILIQIEESRKTPAAETASPVAAAAAPAAPGPGKHLTFREIGSLLPTVLRSSALGAFIGAIPGPGATTSAFASYALERQLSDTPDSFGKGNIKGVAAPDAGNNATCSSTLIPLFTLGIPGAPIAAVFGGALMIHGITPGPSMFNSDPTLVTALMIMFVVASLFLLPVGLTASRFSLKLLALPRSILYPAVLVLSYTGVYANSSSTFDLIAMSVFGLLGYAMRKVGLPASAFVVAFVLGAPMESAFKRAMLISQGDPAVFVASPISVLFLVLTVLACAAVVWQRRRSAASVEGRNSGKPDDAAM